MPRTRTLSKRSSSTRSAHKQSSSRTWRRTDDEWAAWLEHLDARPNLIRLSDLVPRTTTHPLCWPLTEDWPGSESHRLVSQLARLCSGQKCSKSDLARQLEVWLDTAAKRAPEPTLGVECLAWCHALPELAHVFPAAPWHELLELLIETALQAAGLDLLANPVGQQLLAGELPTGLSYVLPEFPDCRQLSGVAGRILSEGIVELLDGEGLPHAEHLPLLRPLLACWTRVSFLDRSLKQPVLNDAARTQLEWLVRQGLRLTRCDGSQVFGSGTDWSADLWNGALEIAGDEDDHHIAAMALPTRRRATDSSQNGVSLPSPAIQSEWAETAVLRRTWDRKSELLAVSYAQRSLRLELNSGAETVWSGTCNPQVSVAAQKLEFQGDWLEVCWVSDEDLDYLELEVPLGGGWCLQRQLVLARQDRFLFVADALLGEQPDVINYECTLPLTDGVRFQPDEDTHDGILLGKRYLGRALPLAFPEWRSETAHGHLTTTTNGLSHSLRTTARRAFAPLFFDLDPRHGKSQVTWRRLTVAENLHIVPPDVAVGYRIQVSNRQWLIYRSLAPRASRSVLGQNFSTEFVLARFNSQGESVKLIEIE